MILNQTNCRRITKLYPECEGYLARLKNIAVRLTSESCKDPNGGGHPLRAAVDDNVLDILYPVDDYTGYLPVPVQDLDTAVRRLGRGAVMY